MTLAGKTAGNEKKSGGSRKSENGWVIGWVIIFWQGTWQGRGVKGPCKGPYKHSPCSDLMLDKKDLMRTFFAGGPI